MSNKYKHGDRVPTDVLVNMRLTELEAENARLRRALSDLLNDCINFDGGKLSDCKMKQAAEVLGECDLTKPEN